MIYKQCLDHILKVLAANTYGLAGKGTFTEECSEKKTSEKVANRSFFPLLVKCVLTVQQATVILNRVKTKFPVQVVLSKAYTV